MYLERHDIEKFLADNDAIAGVKITEITRSTPRNQDAWMLVSSSSIFRTIGGGQLESIAIEKARALLQKGANDQLELNVPLGPEIGQCCGGHVSISIKRLDDADCDTYRKMLKAELNEQPHIYIFGAGHVGKALAEACALLPYKPILIDSREDELSSAPSGIETHLTSIPEATVRSANQTVPLLCSLMITRLISSLLTQFLARNDAAYIGMIGSKTKRASFNSWYKQESGQSQNLDKLTCPIGGKAMDSKSLVINALRLSQRLRSQKS